MQYTRPSNLVIKSVGPIAEWLIDWLFLSSAVIAPVAAGAALYFGLSGLPLFAALCLVIAGCAALGIYARFVAPWQLRIKRLHLEDRDLDPSPADLLNRQSAIGNRKSLKVVFFSDLHLGQFKREAWAQRVVEAVNAQAPDVVLIGGDFVGRTKCCDIAELLAPLRGLRAPRGVYAVFGNHDYGIPGPDHSDDLAQLFPQLNIHLLRNECVTIGHVRVIGVDELWTECDDLPGALAHCAHCTGCTADDDHAQPKRTVVLGHNPDLMMKLSQQHPHLALHDAFFIFGHTHQGQIYIPLLPGLAIPVKSTFYRGLHHTPYGTLYVSSGCGENSTPTRLNTWPEIVVFEV